MHPTAHRALQNTLARKVEYSVFLRVNSIDGHNSVLRYISQYFVRFPRDKVRHCFVIKYLDRVFWPSTANATLNELTLRPQPRWPRTNNNHYWIIFTLHVYTVKCCANIHKYLFTAIDSEVFRSRLYYLHYHGNVLRKIQCTTFFLYCLAVHCTMWVNITMLYNN